MPPVVPLVLTAGAAIRGLRERNRRLDAQQEDAAARTAQETNAYLAGSENDDDEDGTENEQQHQQQHTTASTNEFARRRSPVSASSIGQGRGATGATASRRSSDGRRPSRPSLDRRRSSKDAGTGTTPHAQGASSSPQISAARRRTGSARTLQQQQRPEFQQSGTSSDDHDDYADEVGRRVRPHRATGRSGSPSRDTRPGQTSKSTRSGSRHGSADGPSRRARSPELPESQDAVGSGVKRIDYAGPTSSPLKVLIPGPSSSEEGVRARKGRTSDSQKGFTSEDGDATPPRGDQNSRGAAQRFDAPIGLGGGPSPISDAVLPYAAARPSAQHSAHHWQRFYNLLHPNFLQTQQSPVGTQGSSGLPRTSTWASDAFSSDNEGRIIPRTPGRGGGGTSSQPAVSFQREVTLGGRLLHPTVPSILRSRSGQGSSSQHEDTLPATPIASPPRPLGRPSLALRRTATADSEMSFFSDTDGETLAGTEYSGEDGDDVADHILGRDRREMPALRTGRGRGPGRASLTRVPTRTLALAGSALPLRGWARRKLKREQDEADAGGDDDDDATARSDVERGRRGDGSNGNGEEDDDAADSEEDEEVKHQTYRKTPIISGIMAPFSIMLEVPGFTSSWYLSTGRDSEPVVYAKNPILLDVGLAFSMAFAVFANIAIILRFLEVLRPRKSTLIAIVLLTLHDAINISALAVFGKIHAINDGFTYSEGYWMTMASTLASTIVNITLVADYINTKEFRNAGSGLTRKQRELVIMCMLALFYLSIGALIYALMLGINFETALYFITCTLFTIGFGDITPSTTASRIVLFIYAPAGIVLVALVIATTRETILEQFEQSYKKRREAVKTRYIERQEAKKVNRQLRRAVRLRQVSVGRGGARQWLAENGQILPHVNLAIPLDCTGNRKATEEKKDSRLGKALDVVRAFIETGFSRGWAEDKERQADAGQSSTAATAAAEIHEQKSGKRRGSGPKPGISSGIVMSAGALVAPARAGTAFLRPPTPENGWKEKDANAGGSSNDGDVSPMEKGKSEIGLVSSLSDRGESQAITAHAVATTQPEDSSAAAVAGRQEDEQGGGGGGGEDEMELMERSLRQHREELERHWEDFKREVAQQERNEFVAKMVVSGSLFLVFWLMGAGVFVATEHWNFFEGLYFGFVFFSTIGYGDFSPKSPSGRAFFIVWALFGVGILTVIFSVLGDAWGTIYKNTLSDTSRRSRWKWRHQRRKQKRAQRRKAQQQEDATQDARQEGDGSAVPDANGSIEAAEPGDVPPDSVRRRGSPAPTLGGDVTDEGDRDAAVDDSESPTRPERRDTSDGGGGGGTETSTRRQVAPEQIPLQLARAAMHLHSEAAHLLESQRHVLAEAVTSAPFLHRRVRKLLHVVAAGGKVPRGAVSAVVATLGPLAEGEGDAVDGEDGVGDVSSDPDEVHRRELERLETAVVAALERRGDSAGAAAVRQLFALVHYDDHLSALIESSHMLRDTLVGQERELAELKARVASLEAAAAAVQSSDVGESELAEGDRAR